MGSHEEFLARRRESLGSSDMAAIMGRHPWRTPLHVYLDKIGELPDEEPSEAAMFGQLLQPLVARMYEHRKQVKVRQLYDTIVPHPQYPCLHASIDCLLEPDGQKIVECKTSQLGGKWGEEDTDQIPQENLIQAQHQMECLDLEEADVAVIFGVHVFHVYPVERNRDLGQIIVDAGREFWQRILDRDPPAPDWEHRSTHELLKRINTVDEHKAIELGPEALALAKEHNMLSKHRKECDDKLEVVKSQLIDQMGHAGAAFLPEGWELTRNNINVPAYQVGARSYARLYVKPPKGLPHGN